MYQEFSLPTSVYFNKGSKANTKELIVEPCFPGYGTTIGNSLRRVLLSSLSGAAIVAVKIKGVTHEFSSIEYVKEDALEIILNLKTIRFKVHGDTTEPIKVTLSAQGERVVTAKDIKATSDVEVVNTDAVIAHLTDKSAELEMELFVKKGMGYSPTEARAHEKLELGTIAIDAIFTPIVNVSFKVENVRVGEFTNYDKLVMEIETDGTISPEEAVEQASGILMSHFSMLTKEGMKDLEKREKEKKAKEEEEKSEPEGGVSTLPIGERM